MKTTIISKRKAIGKVLFGMVMVACLMTVFAFNLEGSTKRVKSGKIHGKVYEKVEQMPEFPGGQSELVNFLMKSVKYPQQAMESAIQGKVYVSFVVGEDGSIVNAKIEKRIDPLLDAEALRVVNSMSKWTPGKEKGKNVAVQFTLPISFKLQ